ncbi:uncharacterized protein B0H18DRAFT_1113390 [Fomitopsis serialis]|uniref:uncharacterized protein n=1 Tax=Fomitopsis serialis TaxID=139415 RepID=UPI00200750A5|nr:uncharacterized protein B0H18DRAFT_1113390 [Neoantrodia serialis]KAH9937573.1 hypothetical protein B0H18DRAFT_1113390 [Neoantrodia serialis]
MSKDEGEWEGLEDDEGVTRKREAQRGAPSLVYRVFAAPRVPFPLIAAGTVLMAKKKNVVQESSSESEEQQQYIVEVITKARVDSDGEWEYHVKWANYDSDNNTWEPAENVEACDRLLKGFWRDVGYDNEDYPTGHTVYATPTWITKEKNFFAKHFGSSRPKQSDVNQSSESSEDDQPIPQPPPTRRKATSKASSKKKEVVGKMKRPRSETPSSSTSAKKAKAVKKSKAATRRRQEESDDDSRHESSVSDNVPLTKTKKPKPQKRTVAESSKGKEKASPLAENEESDRAGSLFSGSDGRSSPDVSLASKDKQGSTKDISSKSTTPQVVPARTAPKDPPRGGPSTSSNGKSVPTGIPTKMRLAESATSLVAARPTMQRSKIANLSFKKNTATSGSAANTPVQESYPSPTALFAPSPRSPEGNIPSPAHQSPVLEQRPAFPLPRRGVPPPAPVETVPDVDQFLSTVMPTELAAPMDETAAEPPLRGPVPTASSASKPPIGRIPKKWKWTGEVFIEVEEGRAQRICNIALSDATEPRPNGLRFSICLDPVDSVRLGKLYEVADIYMILRSCTQVQQFAKLGPGKDSDADAVTALAAHLKTKRSFTYARLSLDGGEVALMLVFPSSINELCRLLKVPPQTLVDAPMIAALLPWELTRQEFDEAKWFKTRSDDALTASLDPVVDAAAREMFSKNPAVHRALRILNVPHRLFKFLSASSRTYCIWYSPADGQVGELAGMETAALRTLLAAFKANDMGYKKDVRIVFVHVGALKTIYKLQALAERRNKRCELRFYTYGTHESVPPERWGIREIYPLGGVVTFTPSAILSNIVGVYELIKKIDEHPIWDCYILPSVVAMLAKSTCQDQNPLALFDKGDFFFSDLLGMIEEGKISLLRMPPLTRCPKGGDDPTAKWISWQTELLRADARGLLESSIALAAEQYSSVQANELPDAIQKEIIRDLMGMQMQPAIMDTRRRFVVIKGKSDRYLSEDRDGVECTTATAFDFKDDFFKV